MPSAAGFMPLMASGEKLAESAASASAQRKTPLSEAPVTATRTPSANLATKTATRGKREARWIELLVAGALGDREADLGDDLRAVEGGGEHALEEVVGGDLAAVGDDGGAGPRAPAG